MRVELGKFFKGNEPEGPRDPLTRAFAEEVEKSCRLLGFLIVEERSCRVPDQVIEDIEACREKLKSGNTISDKDRALITKAYRDLIAVPRSSVAYQRILPGKFWDAGSPWTWLFLVFGAIPAIAWVIIHLKWPTGTPYWGDYWYVAPVFYAIISLIVIWGFYAFTGVVTDSKLNQLIGLCYIITAVVLVGSVLPFSNLNVFEYVQPKADLPLSVLKGCALARGTSAPPPSTNNQNQAAATSSSPDIPSEVLCNPSASQSAPANPTDYNFQWVVNIGGIAHSWLPATPTGETKLPSPPAPPPAPTGEVKPPAPLLSGGEAKSPAPPSAPAGKVTQQVPSSPATSESAARDQEFYRISGGLVVPLYVIILAFFGSAVSMTRQVPVYQQRAMDSQDPFSNSEARRSLVFQIMQVLSAPLIAITVYYIYKPSTPAESVVVGFGSGFASEPILLMIRSLVEKLSPARATTTASSAVTIRAEPEAVELGPKQTKQFTAKVQGSGNQEVTWQIIPPEAGAGTISQGGLYSAPDFAADRTVTITATSAADRTKSASASVRLVLPTVRIAPLSLPMKLATTQKITARVLHAQNTEVSWTVHPPGIGGEIDKDGQYKAPATAPTAEVTITATSKADPTKSDSAKVTFQS